MPNDTYALYVACLMGLSTGCSQGVDIGNPLPNSDVSSNDPGASSDSSDGSFDTGTASSTGEEPNQTDGPDPDSGGSGESTSTEPEAATSIYDIRQGELDVGTSVTIENTVVTAVEPNLGLFVQERGGGAYGGIWVFVGTDGPRVATVDPGDVIKVTGSFADDAGRSTIDASSGTVTVTGVAERPTPAVLGAEQLANLEPWESSLVRVEGKGLVVASQGQDSEFELLSPPLVVDDMFFDAWSGVELANFGVGAQFAAIDGPLNYSGNIYKVAPRSAADFEGYIAPAPSATPLSEVPSGGLAVSELMYNPSCPDDDCEWLELYNATESAIDLDGLLVQDSLASEDFEGKVSGTAIVEAGAFAVIAKGSAGTWGYTSVTPIAYYGTAPSLNNSTSGDLVRLLDGSRVIDSTASYSGRNGDDTGYSWKLLPEALDATLNDDAANWCYASSTFETVGDVEHRGSPGTANNALCTEL